MYEGEHRRIIGKLVLTQNAGRPFSSFSFVEQWFGLQAPLRRLFSQARYLEMQCVVLEEIQADGLIQDENLEISYLYPDEYRCVGVRRISFWKKDRSHYGKFASEDCIGYAILKCDEVAGVSEWHIFESILKKNPYPHTYVPRQPTYKFRVGDQEFEISGVLYCQQNGYNKSCAHVALRTLCSLHLPLHDIAYSEINRIAKLISGEFDPARGLTVIQIQTVLDEFGIKFTSVDYQKTNEADLPYQKLLYAGIEAGAGALLGFNLTGPAAAENECHVIPFFGHTFNKDALVPTAECEYFHIGDETGYIPSEHWLSSFVCHDDNFGSHFCIPRLYITPDQVPYVVSAHPNGSIISGMEAEAVSADFLYTILGAVSPPFLPWLKRLLDFVSQRKVVLRPVFLTRREYSQHLRSQEDWEGKRESAEICDKMDARLSEGLWMVELSIPELFPSNLRKLGEVVLDATIEINQDSRYTSYCFIRLPGVYLIYKEMKDGQPEFIKGPSELLSHCASFSDSR